MGAKQIVSKRWLEEIPALVQDSEMVYVLQRKEVNWKHIQAIKELTRYTDDILAGWLNLSVRTFRDYRKPTSILKENVKEQVILLLTLMKHGIAVFGTADAFYTWLQTQNFFFNNEMPSSYLNMITGIRYVDERLTALEYGDNV